jgi:hypothetical protein
MPPHPLRPFLLLALALLGARLAAAPALDVRPAARPPVIDGVISPGEWDGAAHTDAFRQVYPGENVAPSERTELWVTFDSDNVYVAVRCHDSAGLAGIRAYSMQRDQNNGSDDLVRIVFDTFHRQSDGYYFGLTAAGGRHDGLVQNKDESNYQWDGLWTGRVSRDAGGWSCEFAIPVKTLAFDPATTTWGFDVARQIRRTQETVRWANLIRAKGVFSLPDTGELRGLSGLHQGRGLEFKPFASVTARSHPAGDEKRTEFRPGLDFVWHVTPSLAATLTFNTDFADADVDERQVNLGRFPLFFPEKRSFFNQDASLFTFAGIQQDPLPFFSRRIGLADDGSKVDLLGGAKLTGRAGPWTLGLLDVQIDDHAGVDSRNLFVGRITHQVLAESSIGFVATHGDPRSNGDNTLVGADFNYTNSHVLGGKTLSIKAGVQATDSDLAGGRGTAGTLWINFPNEPFSCFAWLSRVDDKFDPALGFVSRTGVTNLHLQAIYNIYPKDHGVIRVAQPFLESDHTGTLGLRRLDGNLWSGVYAENPSGDYANLWIGDHYETYETPFEIRPGIFVPTGRHSWTDYQIEAGTTRARPVDVYVRWRTGRWLTGRGDFYNTMLGWRPTGRLQFGLNAGLRDLRLAEGAFKVRTGSLRASFTFSPDLQVSLIGQYDNLSKSLGTNFRIKWTPTPGNDFYFVVNQGYDTSGDGFRPTAGDISIKGSWTCRF